MNSLPILIVDDRPENLITLEALLEDLLNMPELQVVSAASGNEALSKILDYDFALVLLDVIMPGMDGYEIAELMRGNKKTRHIPIIFVTAARRDDGQVFKGYESGAVDYLVKPIEPQILKGKVKFFLEMHKQRLQLEQKTRELDAKLVELEELHQLLEESNARLRLLSSQDALTGLPNRRSFDEIFTREWQRGVRNQRPLSLIVADIDHFKRYNDTYGHIAGDYCLERVARTLRNSLLREIDIVARYGGEEFTAILPETDSAGAQNVAERMLKAIDELAIRHQSSQTCDNLTISLGISTVIPQSNIPQLRLIEAADKALYEAKSAGRNRYKVCCFERWLQLHAK
ncbi:GGDEF domain-containing response regulator [Desulfovibrio inopinatus]|uniref:GGDEF domain-containing response regulator n=1 Tax=Desulfovibrio inopinatus TaxID=102109 RepID=UPI00040C9A88|nr:diguanylate cyclase [Desulfovibrio inopinatus]